MKEALKDRVAIVERYIGESMLDFATKKGIDSNILTDNMIPIDLIMAILMSYPEISSEWLMRGVGDMITSRQRGYCQYGWHDKIIALEAENKLLKELVGLPQNIKGMEGGISA